MSKLFRNVCVTYNNPPLDFDPTVFQAHCTYYIVAKEKGESGTPHLQCYMEFKNRYRLNRIQRLFKAKVHLEARKGSPQQASEYCKKDGSFVEYGKISKPGKRNDIANLKAAVMKGDSILTLYNDHDAMYKYHRAAKDHRLHLQMADKKFTPMEVICYYGDAGAGKTRLANETYPDIFHVPSVEPLWFDGYSGEDTILLDDFYGGLNYSRLLKILDGYRFSVPIKGGFVWKKWTRVIITSNVHPKKWYPEKKFDALARRFTMIKKVGLVLPQPLDRPRVGGLFG